MNRELQIAVKSLARIAARGENDAVRLEAARAIIDLVLTIEAEPMLGPRLLDRLKPFDDEQE